MVSIFRVNCMPLIPIYLRLTMVLRFKRNGIYFGLYILFLCCGLTGIDIAIVSIKATRESLGGLCNDDDVLSLAGRMQARYAYTYTFLRKSMKWANFLGCFCYLLEFSHVGIGRVFLFLSIFSDFVF